MESELNNGPVKFNGGYKGYGPGYRYASNHLIGVGIKYKFKNFTKNENTY